MKRGTKRFLALAKQLDYQAERRVDLFLRQRPFLTEGGEPKILERTDEDIIAKVENDFAIEKLLKELETL